MAPRLVGGGILVEVVYIGDLQWIHVATEFLLGNEFSPRNLRRRQGRVQEEQSDRGGHRGHLRRNEAFQVAR